MSDPLDPIRHRHAEADVATILAEVDRLTAHAAELEATIANERGTGPTDGRWYWADGQWALETEDGIYIVERNPCPTDDDVQCDYPWLPTTWTARLTRWDDEERTSIVVIGTYDTARAAMRAAHAALTPKEPTP